MGPNSVKKKGFMMACKEFFGYHSGQTLSGFAEEMREVDMAFRKEIHEYLRSTGVECRAPDAFAVHKRGLNNGQGT